MKKSTLDNLVLTIITIGLVIGYLHVYNNQTMINPTYQSEGLTQIEGQIIEKYNEDTGKIQYCSSVNYNIENIKNIKLSQHDKILLEGEYFEGWVNAKAIYKID